MGESVITFSTDLSDPSAYVDLASVGRVYEIGINGVGYMLADSAEDQNLQYQRSTVSLDPQRFATTEAPFSESVERYSFLGFSDFSGGAGQARLDRERSVPNRFFDSVGVDPFDIGKLKLQHAVALESGDAAYASQRAVIVSDKRYLQTGAKELRYKSALGGAATTFSVAAATTIVDLATDGQRWYAAAGAQGIFRGTTADPGAAWSAIQATVADWAGGRLCVAYAGGGSSTPNVFSTLTDAGAEEVASGRVVLNTGWTITDFTGGSGQVWFGAYSGNVGLVYRWHVGTSDAPAIAMELPPGLIPKGLFWVQGQVFVAADRAAGTGSVLLRCPVDGDGNLTPFEVLEMATATVQPGFAADERRVYFSWKAMDTESGVGVVDLSTGGYAKWFKSTGAGSVRSINIWQGKLCFTTDSVGYLSEQTTYVASGWIKTSVSDQASGLDKVYDSVSLLTEALVTGQSVAVDYTADGGVSYVAFTDATLSTAGAVKKVTSLDKKSTSIGLKLTLAGPGTSTPTLALTQVRVHPHGLADTIVQVPISCGDNVTGLNNRPLPENGPGAGLARRRVLEGLAQTRVKFQDIDWAFTGASEIFEVVRVDVRSTSVFDRHVGKNRPQQIAVVTLRKRAK